VSATLTIDRGVLTDPPVGTPAWLLYAVAQERTDPARQSQGLSCARANKVTSFSLSPGYIEAKVEGYGGYQYDTFIAALVDADDIQFGTELSADDLTKLEDGEVAWDGCCTCTEYLRSQDGLWCKHIIATVYTAGTQFAIQPDFGTTFFEFLDDGSDIATTSLPSEAAFVADSRKTGGRAPAKKPSSGEGTTEEPDIEAVEPAQLNHIVAALQVPLAKHDLLHCFATAEQILAPPPALAKLIATTVPPRKVASPRAPKQPKGPRTEK